MTMTAELDAYSDWQARRLEALKAPDGWLNIIARTELPSGTFKVGSAADNDIVLSAGPAHVGTLTDSGADTVSYIPADGRAPIELKTGTYPPPRFSAGDLLLEITAINGTKALRVRDTASKAADQLAPLTYFPYDPSWRITAKWEALDAPQSLTIDTSKSIQTDVTATHRAVFERDGQTYALLATHGTPQSPQFVIRDLTSRDSTYAACRFVYGKGVGDDTIVLDFNKAINPPCAFTEFAVCPLPPPQNVLPIRIEAGEKRLS